MFAVEDVLPAWTTFVMQGGALAILAAYFLIVKPREDQKNRESNEKVAASHLEAVNRVAIAFEGGLERQTEILGGKLDSVKDAACRWRHGA